MDTVFCSLPFSDTDCMKGTFGAVAHLTYKGGTNPLSPVSEIQQDRHQSPPLSFSFDVPHNRKAAVDHFISSYSFQLVLFLALSTSTEKRQVNLGGLLRGGRRKACFTIEGCPKRDQLCVDIAISHTIVFTQRSIAT